MVNIAELRARKGRMTKSKLADELETSITSITQWENDPMTISTKNLVKICDYFNVSADEILGIKKEEK